LITGVLDTARFSAYSDLLSENRVGPAPDQVAAGDHSHPVTGELGVMRRIEDTTTVIVEATTYGYYPGKTVQIPPNTIGHYFRILFSFSIPAGCGPINIGINGDGMPLVSKGYFSNTMDVWDAVCMRHSGQTWYARFENYGGTPTEDFYYIAPVDINPSDGLQLVISIWNDAYTPCYVTLGTLIVEYDVD
jgi:hypothetical protein